LIASIIWHLVVELVEKKLAGNCAHQLENIRHSHYLKDSAEMSDTAPKEKRSVSEPTTDLGYAAAHNVSEIAVRIICVEHNGECLAPCRRWLNTLVSMTVTISIRSHRRLALECPVAIADSSRLMRQFFCMD